LCIYIQLFLWTPKIFPIGANLYQKLRFFAITEAVGPHFKARTVKFGMVVRTWDSLPQAKFYIKNRLRGYTLLGKFIQKITNFDDFGGSKQTF